jgi:amino acid adenylation domain-containing protein
MQERGKDNSPQENLKGLSPERLELLALRARKLRGRNQAASPTPALHRLGRTGIYDAFPLSFAQERLWFLHQLEPESRVYNMPDAARLAGPLDVRAFEDSLNEIIRRHEVLRTSFAIRDGQPLQVIAPSMSLKLREIDLRSLPEIEREAEAARIAALEAWRCFDLATGPLLRTVLLRLGNEEHVIVLTMHHIISDAWSRGLLMRELTALYEARLSGEPSTLPELPVQYADYAAWQREWLQGSVLDELLSYWRQQLSGAAPILEMPTDRPRQTVQTFGGAVHTFRLPQSLSAGLKDLSRDAGVTLFMTLLAAFKTLLYRYTYQEDIVVGTPTAGRHLAEIEGLIGFFINTLILRTDLSGNPTFSQLLSRVQRACLQAYAHGGLPVEKIVQELQPERTMHHNPLWQTTFALQNAPLGGLKLPHLTVSPFRIARTETGDDLYLNMVETAQGLIGAIEYRFELFEAATIQRLAGHFQTLLESIVATPDVPLADLPMLTAAEQQQLIVEWNRTEVTNKSDSSLQQLFEMQAERTPGVVAASFQGQDLTYAELNRRANQVAHFLRRLEVGPDVLVGLCLERSLEMIVGLLGILKAGGAYVPLDPAYPPERLRQILHESQAPVILTTSRLGEAISAAGGRFVCFDTDGPEIAACSDQNPGASVSPLNLGYVIYTSGSTGMPKGVALHQEALVNLVQWYQDNYPLAETRTVQFASINFDVSFEELFTTWSGGGRLMMLTEAQRHDPIVLLNLLSEWAISRMFAPVVVLQQLAQAFCDNPMGGAPQHLRQIITAGSQLQITDEIRQFFSAMPQCELHNNYGPSETHTMMRYRVGPLSADWESLPPIGRPFSNTTIYVLDQRQRLLPVGVPGELCIGGQQVGRGYLNRPDLTAEKFIPTPFPRQGGERLYRSGDLVKSRPDGDIEWLGRIDQQVKVRGFRIELGEIESALRQHPDVQETVAVAREDQRGDQRLVAYFIPRQGRTPPIAELRRCVKELLPSYMVPAAFVRLSSLPLLPNGKIDRRALPAPHQTRPDLGEAFVAPRTATERLLADLWADVLRVKQVGINDNFLELGGDSILSIQVISRAHRAGKKLTLTQLWEHPTIAELAAIAETAPRPQADPAVPSAGASLDWAQHQDEKDRGDAAKQFPLIQIDEPALSKLLATEPSPEEIYPLSSMQQGILFHSLINPAAGEYVEQFSAVLCCALDVRKFKRAWERTIERHPALRTSFAWEGLDEPLQVVHRRFSVPFELADWRGLSTGEQTRRFEAFTHAEQQTGTFDLTAAPLMRLFLFQIADEAYRFVWSFHDIVIDGWSAPLILQEVRASYEALRRGDDSALAPSYPYRDYIARLQGQDFTAAEAFWRKTLRGFTSPTRLEMDRSAGTGEGRSYDRREVYLSAQVCTTLQGLARRHQITLNTFMQGAWASVLSRFAGEEDVVFGNVVSGRPPDLEGVEAIVGVFVNTLPVRVRIEFASSLLAWLKEIQAQQIEARQYEWSPLIQIQRWSDVPPGQSLFESILAFVNYPEASDGFWEERVWYLQKSGYPFFVVVRPGAEMLLEITYDKSEFNCDTVERMLDYFREVLEQMATDLREPPSALPALTEADRRRLIEWNRTTVALPLPDCFQGQFESQVERTPEAIAVVCAGRSLTYAKLNERANRLARSLTQKGVGPETLVALLAERTIEFLIAVLGVFKAGGAYLPLEPLQPIRRTAQLVEQSGAAMVLASDEYLPILKHAFGEMPPASRPPIYSLDELAREQHSQSNLPPRSGPANLAYVIYTSGSTGVPKGAMVEQRGMLNHLHAKIIELGLTSQDCVAQTASQCFDISVWQFLAALLVGGRVHIFGNEIAHNPALLLERVAAEEIAILETVPSLLHVMIEEVAGRAGNQPEDLALRWMIPTGEALPTELCSRWFSYYPRVPLLNAYGPTECSDDVTHYRINQALPPELLNVPIGRPIPNIRLYVLDARGRQVPIKVAGELCVGGVGVGRGYLNDPARTAEVFTPDCFGPDAGARLYRTGDRARFLPDGNIEFLGRLDHQVKIRGFRIEPGEIETVLSQHASVRQCVVTVRPDQKGDKQLVAYVVAHAGQIPTSSELRAYLKEWLAEYMIPAVFMILDSLPLTASGKVNRQALPAPEQAQTEAGKDHVAPETPTERALAKIWTEVLGREHLGINDNFFELGGHSLLATQVYSRVQRAFAIEVPVRKFFELPTIAELSQLIEEMVFAEIEGSAD